MAKRHSHGAQTNVPRSENGSAKKLHVGCMPANEVCALCISCFFSSLPLLSDVRRPKRGQKVAVKQKCLSKVLQWRSVPLQQACVFLLPLVVQNVLECEDRRSGVSVCIFHERLKFGLGIKYASYVAFGM